MKEPAEKTEKRITIRFDLITIAVTVLSFIATLFVYPSLPASIPYHWSVDGSVKSIEKWVAFITAFAPVFIYYIAKSRRKNQTDVSRFLTAMIFVVINWVLILIARG